MQKVRLAGRDVFLESFQSAFVALLRVQSEDLSDTFTTVEDQDMGRTPLVI